MKTHCHKIGMNRSNHPRCSIKKLFWKILQYLQENICVGVFLKDSCIGVFFFVNIAKFLRTPVSQNTSVVAASRWIIPMLKLTSGAAHLNQFIFRKNENSSLSLFDVFYSVGIYMFKANDRNTRTRCEIYSKLTLKILERRHMFKVNN